MAKHFTWLKEYTLDIKEIDEQHHYFVSLLDQVYDAFLSAAPRARQEILLDDLVNYAGNHFATEEKYFDKFNYSDTAAHKEEHRKLKELVMSFQTRFNAGESDLSEELIDFLEDWLVKHILDQDQKYVDCFHEHGLY